MRPRGRRPQPGRLDEVWGVKRDEAPAGGDDVYAITQFRFTLERELTRNPRTTVIALRLYLYNGLAKIEIALARGRRAYDRREVIARRDAERAMQRGMRRAQR